MNRFLFRDYNQGAVGAFQATQYAPVTVAFVFEGCPNMEKNGWMTICILRALQNNEYQLNRDMLFFDAEIMLSNGFLVKCRISSSMSPCGFVYPGREKDGNIGAPA